MPRITLTFLVALPFQENPKILLAQRNKKTKPTHSKPKKSLFEENVEYQDEHYIPCDPNMKYYCTLVYQPIPTIESTTVSIVCWGRVAKIFLKDQMKAVKTIIDRQKIAWVPFSVSHKVKTIKKDDAAALLAHKMEVNFSESSKALIPKAQDDKKELFYSFKIVQYDPYIYEVITPTVKNEIPKLLAPTKKEKLFSHSNSDKTNVKQLLLGIPWYIHRNKIRCQILRTQKRLKELGMPESVEIQLEELKQNIKKKKKKRAKDENEIYDSSESIIITGNELLFDKVVWFKEKYSLSPQILYAGVWLTTDTLLSNQLKDHYKPLSIRIKKLQNMPLMDPVYRKCKQISIEYSLGKIIKNAEINPIPLEKYSKNVIIDNTQTFILRKMQSEQIAESIRTSKLMIKIFGYVGEQAITSGAIFTEDRKDEQFSKIEIKRTKPNLDANDDSLDNENMKPSKSHVLKKIFLGCAEVNCSELMRGTYRIDVKAPIMSGSLLREASQKVNAVDHFNTLEIYDYHSNPKQGALRDGLLIENDCSINICIKGLMVLSGKSKLNQPVQDEGAFTRFFVIFRSTYWSTLIMKKILDHNGNIIGPAHSVTEIPFYKGGEVRNITELNDHLEFKESKKHRNLITGFAIDAINKRILFVEGPVNTLSELVWHALFGVRSKYCIPVYDSDLLFTERLYSDLISIGGLYVITMQLSIEDIFSNPKIYLEGYIPKPAWRGLLLLKKLLNCRSVEMAVQQNLFPTSQELICLNLEYGVPLISVKELQRQRY